MHQKATEESALHHRVEAKASHLAKKSNVKLEIFNQEGEIIRTLLDKELPYGEQKVLFNGSQLSKGVYLCILKTNEGISSTKLIKL